jgi:hypothetical protein
LINNKLDTPNIRIEIILIFISYYFFLNKSLTISSILNFMGKLLKLHKVLALSLAIVILAACAGGYTPEEADYINKVKSVDMKSKFLLAQELDITNKIALLLNGKLKLKIYKVTSDSIITEPSPDEFYWKVAKIREPDGYRLKIFCGYERAIIKRGELSPKRDSEAKFSERALMHYLLTGEIIERLVCCKECSWMAKVINSK